MYVHINLFWHVLHDKLIAQRELQNTTYPLPSISADLLFNFTANMPFFLALQIPVYSVATFEVILNR